MKKIPTLEEILIQPGARESYNRLIESGLSKEHLADQIALLLYVPPKMPNLVLSRSDRQTKLLPDRIENMADEIQQINDKSGLLYEMALEPFAEERRKLRNGRSGLNSTHPAGNRLLSFLAIVASDLCRIPPPCVQAE